LPEYSHWNWRVKKKVKSVSPRELLARMRRRAENQVLIASFFLLRRRDGPISRREARRGVLVSLDIDKALFVGEVAVLVPLKDEVQFRESQRAPCADAPAGGESGSDRLLLPPPQA
jgi:hypothetical protein